MSIDNAFNKSISYYDSWIKNALPCYEELFRIAVENIPYPTAGNIRVLDLGAGTGLFSYQVLQRYHNASFTLIDIADKMLDVSRQRFAGRDEQFEYITGDYCKDLPATTYDVVISSLSIHHLDAKAKNQLFGSVYEILSNGGLFLNVDQIKGPSPYFQDLYWSAWLNRVQETDATKEQIEESVKRRTEFDKDETLLDQLAWMQKAGFEEVDCLYKHYFVGVLYGRKML